MNFEKFEVEGNPKDRGCPAATLRVWPWTERDKTPLELCGDNLEHNSQVGRKKIKKSLASKPKKGF